jgi:hypothetical protein
VVGTSQRFPEMRAGKLITADDEHAHVARAYGHSPGDELAGGHEPVAIVEGRAVGDASAHLVELV